MISLTSLFSLEAVHKSPPVVKHGWKIQPTAHVWLDYPSSKAPFIGDDSGCNIPALNLHYLIGVCRE